MCVLLNVALRDTNLLALMGGLLYKSAHTGNRAQVTSMEGLYDATTLRVMLADCALISIDVCLRMK